MTQAQCHPWMISQEAQELEWLIRVGPTWPGLFLLHQSIISCESLKGELEHSTLQCPPQSTMLKKPFLTT